MLIRDTDFITLEDLLGEVDDHLRYWSGSSTAPEVHIDEEPEEEEDAYERLFGSLGSSLREGESLTINGVKVPAGHLDREAVAREDRKVGTITLKDHEVPVTERGLIALSAFYGIPSKFLLRVTPAEQQFILSNRIQRSEDLPLVVRYDDRGISQAYKATGKHLDPHDLVEKAIDYVGGDAKVVDYVHTPDWFNADVIVPEDMDGYIGADPNDGQDRAFGGIRFGQNRKQNLSPYVQPYVFRLATTCGFEVPVYGIRVEGREALDEGEVLMLWGNEVKVALDHTQKDIEHLYGLRTQPLDGDRTGLFRKIAQEYGLPERTIGKMEDRLPDALLEVEDPTLFDFAIHITSQANEPDAKGRLNARRALEQAGGTMITDHAARCANCHSRLA